MTKQARRMTMVGGVMLALALAGPLTGANASSAGIKRAFKSYASKILVAEGHVVSAIGTFKSTHEPAPVVTAISESQTVLKALRAKVEHQSAGTSRVKKAKHDIVAGLTGIISAYSSLSTAISETTTSHEAAEAEAAKSETVVKKAKKELESGIKLLGG